VTKIGTLPIAVTDPAAATLGPAIVVIGGSRATGGVNESSTIFSIAPPLGRATTIGALPQPLAGAVAISRPNEILLFGGIEPGGQASSAIYRVRIINRVAPAASRRNS
jgi:N-acetylneuraminic acid mutarotase